MSATEKAYSSHFRQIFGGLSFDLTADHNEKTVDRLIYNKNNETSSTSLCWKSLSLLTTHVKVDERPSYTVFSGEGHKTKKDLDVQSEQ